MSSKHGITLFLVPHDRRKMISLRLKGWYLTLAAILFGVSIVLFLIGVILGGRSAKLIAENRALFAENRTLKLQREKIAKLELEVERTNRLRNWMEEMLGIVEGDRKVATASASGHSFDIFGGPFKARLNPELSDEAERRKRKMDFIPKGRPVQGVVTARFGEMGGKFLKPHTGIDIAAPSGTIVRATAAGIVSAILNDPGIGIAVELDHLNGMKTRYGHLSFVAVAKGERVERGDKIGFVGETGHTTGAHVHYEIIVNGSPVDPEANAIPENESEER